MAGCTECGAGVEALGLCQRHYFRLRRTGTTAMRDNRPLLDRLEARFGLGGATEQDIEDAYRDRFQVVGPMHCWAMGDPNRRRYPMGRTTRGPKSLHRAVFRLVYGEPQRDVIRHTCDRPACIRPSHLLDGTHAENSQDREARKQGLRPYQRHGKGIS